MSAARELANFLTGVTPSDLPAQAMDHAAVLIASTLASAAMGSTLESSGIVKDMAVSLGGSARASIWFDKAGSKLPVVYAAQVNAVRALVHDMMRQRWGRIVNITTSLGTMIREGSPTYGPSKAALEAFSAIMAKDLAGSGVTVNVLVPGGVTNTGMVPLEAGYDRAEMIQPAVMAAPLNWLVSDAAGGVTGRRFLAVHWDPNLPLEEAAAKAGAPVAWTEIATMPIEPPRRN